MHGRHCHGELVRLGLVRPQGLVKAIVEEVSMRFGDHSAPGLGDDGACGSAGGARSEPRESA